MNPVERTPSTPRDGARSAAHPPPAKLSATIAIAAQRLGQALPPGVSIARNPSAIPEPNGLIRHQLRSYLLRADGPPMIVLHAPAGYGKTTLMAQAAEQCAAIGAIAGWATLGRQNPTAALAAGIASALPEAPAGGDIDTILDAVEDRNERFHLFIDDYQSAAPAEAAAALAHLIQHGPPNLRLVVASRTRMPLNLAALRIKHLVEILDASTLAFTDAEWNSLRGPRTLNAAVDSFLGQAEGWPVMVAIALDATAAIGPDGGPRAALPLSICADYLDEEILAYVPEALRRSLRRLSVLDEIGADLAGAVLERDDGAELLDWMSAQGLLSLSQSEWNEGYRLNPLLRGHLAAGLRRDEPGTIQSLNARAARFYLDRDNSLKATRYAILSNDIGVIQRLFQDTSIIRLAFVGGGMLLNMLKDVDPAVSRMLPHLILAEIYLLLMGNQPLRAARAFKALKEETKGFTAVPECENAALMEADAIVVEMLIAGYTDNLTVEMIAAAEHRLAQMPASDEILLLVLRQLKVWAHYWDGYFLHPDKLRDLLWCRPTGPDPSYVDLYGSLALGVCALERGDLDHAEAHHRHASDLAIRFGGRRGSQAKTARLLLADVAYERNQIERARNLVDGLVEEVERGEGWFDLYSSAYLTGSLLAFETSWEGALSVLDRGDATAARVELPRLSLLIAAQRLKLAVMAGEMHLAQNQYQLLEQAGALDLLPETVRGFGWRITVPAQLAAARFHIARNEPQEALDRLARMPVRREGHRQNRRLVEIHLLTGIAFDRIGNWAAASDAFSQALQLGSRTGMERVFIDLGDILATPLDTFLRRRSHDGGEEVELAKRLSPLLSGRAHTIAHGTSRSGDSDSTILLSERERDVLNILATGKTYKEIAYDLQISINTVMTHRKKLYRKLDTSSRSKALARARSVGLIP